VADLFRHGLTPQRKYLLAQTRDRISRGILRTSDLQLALLHFREAKLGGSWLWESASSIAHVKRDQGTLRAWGLRVWATHLFYENIDRNNLDVTILPLDIFETICWLIEDRAEWQLQDELDDIYPYGFTKAELLATLRHLYHEKMDRRGDEPTFVQLVSKGGNLTEDIRLVRRLVLYCEPMALSVGPTPMDEIVDAIDEAFCDTVTNARFTEKERVYLQLHLLVSLHNVLLDIRSNVFKVITHEDPPQRQAMLAVSAMNNTLTVDVAFYFRDEGKHLDQADLRSPDRFDRFRCPLLRTNLSEEVYLFESDINIRCCLFNHPLEVRKHPIRDHQVIVALERGNAKFKPTHFRGGEPNY
jgi:hypothetical protein